MVDPWDWQRFDPDPQELEAMYAAGFYELKCGSCGHVIWCTEGGALLNGVSRMQFSTPESPVAGMAYECVACQEKRYAEEDNGG